MVRHSAAYRLTHPLRLRAFGVGLNKSGTHSLAAMFCDPIRAAHEPDAAWLVDFVMAVQNGEIADATAARALQAHLRRSWVDVEVSHPLGDIIDLLVAVEPEAQYIMTLRPPEEFLRSVTNAHLVRPSPGRWSRYRAMRFATGHDPTPHDAPLVERGLHPVAGYLSRWRWRNERVLDHVPPEQLLVVRTDQLGARAADIADFLGIDRRLVDARRSHQFATGVDYGVFDALDRGYVQEQVDAALTPRLRALLGTA